jgi:hypothetical protein
VAIIPENITATVKPGPPNEQWGTPNNGWRVTLRNGRGGRYTVPFYTGLGLTGEPTAADVIQCLVSDAAGYRDTGDFQEWCSDYGMDTDSRAAHKTWKACRRISERLHTFLTPEEFSDIQESEH